MWGSYIINQQVTLLYSIRSIHWTNVEAENISLAPSWNIKILANQSNLDRKAWKQI